MLRNDENATMAAQVLTTVQQVLTVCQASVQEQQVFTYPWSSIHFSQLCPLSMLLCKLTHISWFGLFVGLDLYIRYHQKYILDYFTEAGFSMKHAKETTTNLLLIPPSASADGRGGRGRID